MATKFDTRSFERSRPGVRSQNGSGSNTSSSLYASAVLRLIFRFGSDPGSAIVCAWGRGVADLDGIGICVYQMRILAIPVSKKNPFCRASYQEAVHSSPWGFGSAVVCASIWTWKGRLVYIPPTGGETGDSLIEVTGWDMLTGRVFPVQEISPSSRRQRRSARYSPDPALIPHELRYPKKIPPRTRPTSKTLPPAHLLLPA